jgi:Na+(H+)/acetate symporter ActP
MIPLAAVVLVVVATIFIGAYGVRLARTTSDVLVASRTVPPMWNASAISGEYLSAASFLGVAGLILKYGVDMLWYPVGYAAGYLILLLFVAAPLRRSGAYTLPDFAEGRFDSPQLRKVATGFVLLIGWFYLLPQMKGAGVTLSVLAGTPYWVGVIVVGSVITANVALGGMRGITFVQAFQYWVKVTAIALPAIVILGVFQRDGRPDLTRAETPAFTETTEVEFDVDATFVAEEAVVVDARGTVDGEPVDGELTLEPGEHTAAHDTVVVFPAGSATPHEVGIPVSGGDSWAYPSGPIGEDRSHPLFFTYSLLLATFLGTMGLPHILVRFYTNPDGRAARQTTVIVLALMAIFYVFPPVYGFLGRHYTPELYLTGRTDAVVLVLPGRLVGGLAGELLSGLVAAGAFAAFMSTSSGLLISVAGALTHDVLRGGVRQFRMATVVAGVVAMLLGLWVSRFDINMLVGWAFAIAASSFCPLLVLGIWWTGLTLTGALAGILTGGTFASLAILSTMAGVVDGGWPEALLTQPAAWSVPIAFLTMIMVSKLTRTSLSTEVQGKLLAFHLPERATVGRTVRPSIASPPPSVDAL